MLMGGVCVCKGGLEISVEMIRGVKRLSAGKLGCVLKEGACVKKGLWLGVLKALVRNLDGVWRF